MIINQFFTKSCKSYYNYVHIYLQAKYVIVLKVSDYAMRTVDK